VNWLTPTHLNILRRQDLSGCSPEYANWQRTCLRPTAEDDPAVRLLFAEESWFRRGVRRCAAWLRELKLRESYADRKKFGRIKVPK